MQIHMATLQKGITAFVLLTSTLVSAQEPASTPESLESLIKDSIERAFSLRVQKLNQDKTDNQLYTAWTGLLPSVSLSSGRTLSNTGSIDEAGTISTASSRSDTLSVSATWKIWDGFQNVRNVRLASLDQDIQTLQSDLEVQNHIVEVVNQYLGLQELYVRRATAAEVVKNARAFAEEAEELVKLGGKTRIEQMDTEIQLKNFENDAQELEYSINAAERQFAILLNLPEKKAIPTIDVLKSKPYFMEGFEKTLPEIRRMAEQDRIASAPELRIEGLRVDRTLSSFRQTTLGYLPSTSFTLSKDYDLDGYVVPGTSEALRKSIPSTTATFSLSWTVWDWFATHRDIRNSSKDLEIQRIEFTRKNRQVRNDFLTSLEQYDTLERTIENARLVLDQAISQMEYTRAMYQMGRIGLLQAQTSSERLANARVNLITRLRTQYVAAAKLLVQVGQGVIPPGLQSELIDPARVR